MSQAWTGGAGTLPRPRAIPGGGNAGRHGANLAAGPAWPWQPTDPGRKSGWWRRSTPLHVDGGRTTVSGQDHLSHRAHDLYDLIIEASLGAVSRLAFVCSRGFARTEPRI